MLLVESVGDGAEEGDGEETKEGDEALEGVAEVGYREVRREGLLEGAEEVGEEGVEGDFVVQRALRNSLILR